MYYLQNRINSTIMLFLSMYTFMILTMRVSAKHNSCQKRTKWSKVRTDTQTNTQTNRQMDQVRSQSRDLLKCIYRYTEFNLASLVFRASEMVTAFTKCYEAGCSGRDVTCIHELNFFLKAISCIAGYSVRWPVRTILNSTLWQTS